MPVLALGGDEGVGNAMYTTIAALGDHVEGGVIKGTERWFRIIGQSDK
jgi:hypothetical protein